MLTAQLHPPLPIQLSSTHHARLALFGTEKTKQIEKLHASRLPEHALMQRAGWAVARLALSIAPHAQKIWIACGSGNNGGDGLQAAAFLKAWGKQVYVNMISTPEKMPPDAQAAWQTAQNTGVHFTEECPALLATDLCIDALLGIGIRHSKAPGPLLQRQIQAMQKSPAPVLAIDIPSGLMADTGSWSGDAVGVQAEHTLSLLTLKPGLFTAHGRDACGNLWFHDLGASAVDIPADAYLQGARLHAFKAHPFGHPEKKPKTTRLHNSHKGCFGDVYVVGGTRGMQGAAVLAGEAALFAGAGKVHTAFLSPAESPFIPPCLMVHDLKQAPIPKPALKQAAIVAGCGGGDDIAKQLPYLLQNAKQLVLDADALNAIAQQAPLKGMLQKRAALQLQTILTPHPLEAARLLNSSVTEIQKNRLQAAQQLADSYQCIVALKGSGSICTLPREVQKQLDSSTQTASNSHFITINYSGNERLATAGTGDVLTGCMAAFWAQIIKQPASLDTMAWQTAWQACLYAVHTHGHIANTWNPDENGALTAQKLAQQFRRP